jgi:ABC-type Fe3+/spermidine/putrescine transport system ATPase subunit
MVSYISLNCIRKHFGQVVAVNDVSLEIEEGEFLTLLGPSGCGKTTLLRLLGGLEKPDSGSTYLMGQCIDNLPPNKRPFGMVFQSYALFPHLSVFDNVAFGLKIRKQKEQDIRRKVKKSLELVGLVGVEKRFSGELSGGQQQRVALARSLVLEPSALLLDEPLSNLDAKLRAEMRRELKRIQEALGVTTIYVTHDQQEAFELSDRVAIINEGKLVQLGKPVDLYKYPENRFVAEFIGDANFIEGTVADVQDKVLMKIPGGVVEATIPDKRIRPEIGQQLVAVVRPRKLHVSKEIKLATNSIRGVIEDFVPLGGDEVRYLIRTDAGVLKAIVPSSHEAFETGQTARVSWESSDLIVISKEDRIVDRPAIRA